MAGLLGALVIGALVMPWIQPVGASPGALAVGLVWAAATSALLLLYRRRADLRLPLLALALVVARLAFDVVYLPAMNLSRVSGYPPHIARVLEMADGAPIYLAGAGETRVREAAIGPIRLGEVSYTIPPHLTYQIPWHIARMSGNPLIWKPDPQPGDWCLIAEALVDTTRTTIHYRIHDHWIDRELALVQWERQAD